MDTKMHWEHVYATRPADRVGWYQAHAERSLRLIDATNLPPTAAIIDVGGGASTLVDDLLHAGYADLTVLDLSGTALATAAARLGAQAAAVCWQEADVTTVALARERYDLWHDRAVFHFLTDEQARAAYRAAVLRAVKPGGWVLMAPNDWAGLHQALLGALATTGAATHLVAVRENVLVGSVLLFPAADGDPAGTGGRMIWPELRLLAVAPVARGQGIGAALVQACIAQARAAGATILALYTADSMRTAIALYERLGFTRIPQYDFLPPGTEQLVKAYRLALAPTSSIADDLLTK